MSRTSTLILLGILVIFTPFSGLPVGFRSFLSVLFGLGVCVVGFTLRSQEVAKKSEGEEPMPPTPPVVG